MNKITAEERAKIQARADEIAWDLITGKISAQGGMNAYHIADKLQKEFGISQQRAETHAWKALGRARFRLHPPTR